MKHALPLIALLSLIGLPLFCASAGEQQDSVAAPAVDEPPPIAPAESIGTGLLLQPPLDIDWFTREKFLEAMSTVGAEKIRQAVDLTGSSVAAAPASRCTGTFRRRSDRTTCSRPNSSSSGGKRSLFQTWD